MGFLIDKKIIDRTKKIIVNSFVNLNGLLDVRNSFFLFYKTGIQSLINNKESINYFRKTYSFYYKQAIKYSDLAISYDPHKKVVENVDKILDQLNLADKINSYLGKAQLTLLVLGIIPQILNYSEGEYIFGLFMLLALVLQAYKYILLLDTETLQLTNEKLVFTRDDLESFPKEKEAMIAAFIWNKSLCSYTCIPSLTVLLVIKKISNNVYNQVVQNLLSLLTDYMPIYVGNKSRFKFYRYTLNRYIINKLNKKGTQL